MDLLSKRQFELVGSNHNYSIRRNKSLSVNRENKMICGSYTIRRLSSDSGEDCALMNGWFTKLTESEALREMTRFRTNDVFLNYVIPCNLAGKESRSITDMFLDHCLSLKSEENNRN